VLSKFDAAADYTVGSDHRLYYIRCDDQTSSSFHLGINFPLLSCVVTEKVSSTRSADVSSIKCACHCNSPQELITAISIALWVSTVELGEALHL
jgi:hypothetical protein